MARPTQAERIAQRAAADALYRARMDERERVERERWAEIAAQHRASLPPQPDVDRLRPPIAIVVGRRTSSRMFGESQ